MNGIITPRVYSTSPVGEAFGHVNLIGALMQLASLVMVIFIVLIDAAAEKTDKMLLRQYKKELRQRYLK